MKNKKDKSRKSVYFGFIERVHQYIGNGTDNSMWYYRLSTEKHIYTSYIVGVEFVDGMYEFETRNSI